MRDKEIKTMSQHEKGQMLFSSPISLSSVCHSVTCSVRGSVRVPGSPLSACWSLLIRQEKGGEVNKRWSTGGTCRCLCCPAVILSGMEVCRGPPVCWAHLSVLVSPLQWDKPFFNSLNLMEISDFSILNRESSVSERFTADSLVVINFWYRGISNKKKQIIQQAGSSLTLIWSRKNVSVEDFWLQIGCSFISFETQIV